MSSNQDAIRNRLFIVGSARSGTTLLQAMLAKNSEIYTFPESHFFCGAVREGRRKRWFGLANVTGAQAAVDDLLQLVGRKNLSRSSPKRDPRLKSYARYFREVVDTAALEQGKPVWLEKTPHHIDHLKDISKLIPGAKFIHIVRDGRDVVASQYAAQQQDSEYWRKWTVTQMAHSWGRDLSTSLSFAEDSSHFLVSYSALTSEPERILKDLCQFAELKFEPEMLNHWEAANTVLGKRVSEPWMQQVLGPIKDTHLLKFKKVFTPDQQESVISILRFGGDVHSVFMAKRN